MQVRLGHMAKLVSATFAAGSAQADVEARQ
jgi:hypothetical protein